MKKGWSFFVGVAAVFQVGLCTAWGSAEPAIESQAAVVMEAGSGEVIYEKNGSELYYPASITKLLTALVVSEECNLEDTVIFSYDAVYDVEEGSGNKLQLEAGDKLTVEACLYAMLLESSNQAANALAEHAAGSREAFVEEMNAKIRELGCTKSRFTNPSGLNDPMQKTSAEEMAVIAGAALRNTAVRRICSAKEYELPATLHNPQGYPLSMEHQLVNDSTVYEYDYAIAGKTGYTSLAGNTLVTEAEKDGDELIAVILKSDQTHYEDTMQLFEYGFQVLDDRALMPVQLSAEKENSGKQSTEENHGESDIVGDEKRGGFLGFGLGAGLVVLSGAVVIHFRIKRERLRRRKRRENIRRKRSREKRAA